MSVTPKKSAPATHVTTASSSIGDMSLHKVASKELSRASDDELIEVRKYNNPIYVEA